MLCLCLGIRPRRAAVGALSAAAIVSGCAAIDSNLTGRVGNLNASLDQAINDGILANIMRARNLQPLSFVAVSKVNSTQTVSMANGLPTFTFGPGLTTAQHQFAFAGNNMNNSVSGNFDLAPLATKEFARGVSSEISGPELYTLIKQGIPRDLLYNLAIDAIEYTEGYCPPNKKSKNTEKTKIKNRTETTKTEITRAENKTTQTVTSESTETERTKTESVRPEAAPADGAKSGTGTAPRPSGRAETTSGANQQESAPVRLRNDPSDDSYVGFRSLILVLVAAGFSIETRVDINPAWDREDKTSTKFMTVSRFCFDQSLADPISLNILKPGREWYCGTEWSRLRPDKYAPSHKPIRLWQPGGRTLTLCDSRPHMRSLYGMFGFLGRQLKDREETFVRAAEDKSIDWTVLKELPLESLRTNGENTKDAVRGIANAATRAPPAVQELQTSWARLQKLKMDLRSDGGTVQSVVDRIGKPILRVPKGRGGLCFASATVGDEAFCVPQDVSDNTKRVFSVLAQLLALKTTAADLPVTPSVRITP